MVYKYMKARLSSWTKLPIFSKRNKPNRNGMPPSQREDFVDIGTSKIRTKNKEENVLLVAHNIQPDEMVVVIYRYDTGAVALLRDTQDSTINESIDTLLNEKTKDKPVLRVQTISQQAKKEPEKYQALVKSLSNSIDSEKEPYPSPDNTYDSLDGTRCCLQIIKPSAANSISVTPGEGLVSEYAESKGKKKRVEHNPLNGMPPQGLIPAIAEGMGEKVTFPPPHTNVFGGPEI